MYCGRNEEYARANTAIANPGAAASLTVVSGASQVASAGATLSAPLVVKVTDQYGNAVPGVTVQWNDDANGTFATPTEVTDSFGLATNFYTLGPNPGPENISALVATAAATIATTLVEVGS